MMPADRDGLDSQACRRAGRRHLAYRAATPIAGSLVPSAPVLEPAGETRSKPSSPWSA